MNIATFKAMPYEELESDAFSHFYKYQGYLLEKIYVEDQREQVYLLNAYKKVQKLQLPNVVKYYEIDYNQQEKCIEVLRKYYQTKLLDYQQRSKETIISITQQLFQTLASLEGYGIYLLGLKPTNVFIENQTLFLSGFVRSDKFLLQSPMYQSTDLRYFIKECISNNCYNITVRYQRRSHAMCYSALVILIQFLLQEENEKITNLVRWIDGGNDNLKSVQSTEQLLDRIEDKYDGLRVLVQLARVELMQFENENELGMQFMMLGSELYLSENIILLGDRYFKDIKPPPLEQKQQQQQQQQQKQQGQMTQKQEIKQPNKKEAKRCGGGFTLKKK